ncbi:MAG: hypothetical protein WD805_00200 [Gaiellaceae bacterium]
MAGLHDEEIQSSSALTPEEGAPGDDTDTDDQDTDTDDADTDSTDADTDDTDPS